MACCGTPSSRFGCPHKTSGRKKSARVWVAGGVEPVEIFPLANTTAASTRRHARSVSVLSEGKVASILNCLLQSWPKYFTLPK